LKVSIRLKDFLAGLVILSVHLDAKLVWSKTRLLRLSVWRPVIIEVISWVYLVTVYYSGISILWQFVIRLSKLLLSMGVRTVLAELTLALLDPELALLGFVVIVLYIHHFKYKLSWKWLYKKGLISFV
jgi:hypothetical protein